MDLEAIELVADKKDETLEPYSNKQVQTYDDTEEERYQRKKTLATGMMDLSLLAANSNQLRHILESPNHPFFKASLQLITASLICQVFVVILLLFNASVSVPIRGKNRSFFAHFLNNLNTTGVIVISVVNVFVSTFGVPVLSTYSPSYPNEVFNQTHI